MITQIGALGNALAQTGGPPAASLVSIIHHRLPLTAIEARWRALEARSDPSLFQSWPWVGCLAAERFDRPVLTEILQDDTTVCLAIGNQRRARWPIGTRLHVGESGDAALDAVFVEHNGPLLAAGLDPRTAASVLQACLRAMLTASAQVTLGGVGDAIRDAAGAAGVAGVPVRQQTRIAPWIDLAALRRNGRAYLDSLSGNTRYQLRRSMRHYAATGPVRVERAGSQAEAGRFFAAMGQLHQATWTQRGERGAFANPEFVRFHLELLQRTHADGLADMLRISAGSRVVGYLYNFNHRGRVYAYQSGFDYGVATAQERPGLTCHHAAIEYYLNAGADEYDFLAGDDRYKSSLSTQARSLHWLTLARPGSIPAAAARAAAAVRRARRGLTGLVER